MNVASAIEGVGLGLRWDFARELLAARPEKVRWLEVSPENFIGRGGLFPAVLRECAGVWPVVTHGLTLSIAGCDPFDRSYLRELRAFLADYRSPWHSEHLCWGSIGGVELHELLPAPHARDTVARVVDRLRAVQDVLACPLAIENITYYATPPGSSMPEAEFLAEIMERADVGLLLDVNNVYVNARNHGLDARAFLRAIPTDRVVQMHVAGHAVEPEGLRIDTHGAPICDDVYDLLAFTLARVGRTPVLLERDHNIPPLEELVAEVDRLDAIWRAAPERRP
jgi:uncharacterized protein (UPF0276 family)